MQKKTVKKHKPKSTEICQNIGCSEPRAPGSNQCEEHTTRYKAYVKEHENQTSKKRPKENQKEYEELLAKYNVLQKQYTMLYNKKVKKNPS